MSCCSKTLVGVAVPLAATILLSANDARADVSSWLYVGTGPGYLQQTGDTSPVEHWSLQMESGLGTPPSDIVVVGGLFRAHTFFGKGTDLALTARTATRGFVNGSWGGALDLGGFERFWGARSTGALGSLVLGAPWGITLSLGYGKGTNDVQMYTATLGVDLARLTVYRRMGDRWWKNPFPAYRPEDDRTTFR